MWFRNNADLQTEVSTFFAECSPNFWKVEISKLCDRYNMHHARASALVEK